ncbi:Rv3235 family protein [Salinibacterium sp. SYSU T00001]|uniref:Rv3235 family protein n=1 Tax=Homoserinimonas sedimenticola TaxID=2986805 RepID=UPI002236AF4F|nr:Rv3235 family protein [Salinibacterium sedimenticola]MCW4384982.1 Rv3235 family protein [Salinibacterium sedimenticola]
MTHAHALSPQQQPVGSPGARRATERPVASPRMPSKVIRAPFESDAFFGAQPTASASLPDPNPLLENLTRCVIEILAGARDLQQIARWVTDEVYRNLLKRVVLSDRARRARGEKAARPNFTIGSVVAEAPRDGVIEAVVIVHGRARSRAVAIRLEGLDSRWRATAINVL